MADAGYERPELWLSDGWHTAQRDGWEAPLYWERDGDDWSVLTLDGRRPVRDEDPVVHVSHYEADAYAHWTGFRLPTEQEWETIAVLQPAPLATSRTVTASSPASAISREATATTSRLRSSRSTEGGIDTS